MRPTSLKNVLDFVETAYFARNNYGRDEERACHLLPVLHSKKMTSELLQGNRKQKGQ
jgi:hypothetical protein